jgi:protoporphyrinogen/coproporphyrinogen III oxidase
MEQSHGSLIRAIGATPTAKLDPDAPRTAFASPRNGMQELIETLQSHLTGDIRLGQAVTTIGTDRTVHLANGDTLRPEAVILAAPLGKVRIEGLDITPLPVVSSATVTFGYRAEEIEHPLDGFGFVVPSTEPVHVRASTWSSTKLAGRVPDGYALLRVFFGGPVHGSDVDLPDEQLITLAQREIKQIMGIRAEPVISRIFRWRNANPQYEVGHVERLARLNATLPAWLQLAGCTVDGVGIPDCIRQGRDAVKRAVSLQDERVNPEAHKDRI